MSSVGIAKKKLWHDEIVYLCNALVFSGRATLNDLPPWAKTNFTHGKPLFWDSSQASSISALRYGSLKIFVTLFWHFVDCRNPYDWN